MRLLYLFFLFPLINLIIFRYVPIYGIVIAFKDYRMRSGIMGSPWNNFQHFKDLFTNPYFFRILRNTVVISFMRLGFSFPAPIVLALLINEIRNIFYKRLAQSILYLPHFMSWVVLSGILIEVLSPETGIWAWVFDLFGKQAPNLFINKSLFRPLLIVTNIWQQAGWGTIVYLAAISSIDPGLYESAAIDGAGRWQQAAYITLPSLVPVLTIMLLLRIGQIMNAGFDQIFNMYNPLVYEVADIIDTFVYRDGLLGRNYEISTVAGVFKNGIGVALLLSTNAVIKRFNEYGIW